MENKTKLTLTLTLTPEMMGDSDIDNANFIYSLIMDSIDIELNLKDRKLNEQSDIKILVTVDTISNE